MPSAFHLPIGPVSDVGRKNLDCGHPDEGAVTEVEDEYKYHRIDHWQPFNVVGTNIGGVYHLAVSVLGRIFAIVGFIFEFVRKSHHSKSKRTTKR